MSEIKRLRCAVYTRKSSEEGLDQAFNSLDAQREACEAYIASQASLGWKLVPDPYDDGGISGGTLERPGIQKLLRDIREGRIDVVVVYKIDRLTRSLMDFAKLVEVFDGNAVSFVSVTQQFNTTTSMGRLTLNVLLSFAQFEREVTAERIRDKVAASKKKGIWMGGVVPFGYRAQDRKLVIDEVNAAAVRRIYKRYLELRSVPALRRELNGPVEQRIDDTGGSLAASATRCAYSRGKVYHILANPIYIGKIRHKATLNDGEHEAIIDHQTFDAVQRLLAERAASPKGSTTHTGAHLLAGLLYDEHGNRLTPVYSTNHGKRYRYYVTDTRRVAAKGADPWRVAATIIEPIAIAQFVSLLKNKSQLTGWIQEFRPALSLANILDRAAILHRDIAADQTGVLATTTIKAALSRMTLSSDRIRYDVDAGQLLDIVSDHNRSRGQESVARSSSKLNRINPHRVNDVLVSPVTITQPIMLKRRGVEMRIMVHDGAAPSQSLDQALVDAVAKAHLALKRLTDGSKQSIATVADNLKMDASDLSRILPLAFLSPRILEVILTGRQPPNLTLRSLTRGADLPMEWSQQEQVLLV